MRERRPSVGPLGPWLAVGLALALAAGFGLALLVPAAAQQPEVRITQLDCEGDPELVVIRNSGATDQDLAGWRLESDPPQQEYLDLSDLGLLLPGAAVVIESGPSAGGIFVWINQFVFRDGDASDYARLVDDTGAVVDQVNCPGTLPTPTPEPSPMPSPTPTAAPSPSPSPTPQPSPPASVPNGGGPPPPASGGLATPAMVIALGGGLLAMGTAALGLPWPRASRRRPEPGAPAARGGSAAVWAVGLLLVVLLLALALRRRGWR